MKFLSKSKLSDNNHRYNDSHENRYNDIKPEISPFSSTEILKRHKKTGNSRLPKNRRPGQLDDDLDPEIEAARRTYKKRGGIEITEEDED